MWGDGCVKELKERNSFIKYYQIITLHSLNILQFYCQLYLNKAEGEKQHRILFIHFNNKETHLF